MLVHSVFLFAAIVATIMEKCETRYFLVKIGDAEERCKFHIFWNKLGNSECIGIS